MAEQVQSFQNHTRFDPIFHAFALPVAVIGVLVAGWNLFRMPEFQTAWQLVMSMVLAVTVLLVRVYALKVQDRVIRLEERLRLTSLLSSPDQLNVLMLTEGQLVALRFASDEELPQLAERAVNQNLRPAEIKKAIQKWRPDHWRV